MLLPSGSPPPSSRWVKRAAGELMPRVSSSFEQKWDTEVAVSTSYVTEMLQQGRRWGRTRGVPT